MIIYLLIILVFCIFIYFIYRYNIQYYTFIPWNLNSNNPDPLNCEQPLKEPIIFISDENTHTCTNPNISDSFAGDICFNNGVNVNGKCKCVNNFSGAQCELNNKILFDSCKEKSNYHCTECNHIQFGQSTQYYCRNMYPSSASKTSNDYLKKILCSSNNTDASVIYNIYYKGGGYFLYPSQTNQNVLRLNNTINIMDLENIWLVSGKTNSPEPSIRLQSLWRMMYATTSKMTHIGVFPVWADDIKYGAGWLKPALMWSCADYDTSKYNTRHSGDTGNWSSVDWTYYNGASPIIPSNDNLNKDLFNFNGPTNIGRQLIINFNTIWTAPFNNGFRHDYYNGFMGARMVLDVDPNGNVIISTYTALDLSKANACGDFACDKRWRYNCITGQFGDKGKNSFWKVVNIYDNLILLIMIDSKNNRRILFRETDDTKQEVKVQSLSIDIDNYNDAIDKFKYFPNAWWLQLDLIDKQMYMNPLSTNNILRLNKNKLVSTPMSLNESDFWSRTETRNKDNVFYKMICKENNNKILGLSSTNDSFKKTEFSLENTTSQNSIHFEFIKVCKGDKVSIYC